MKIIANRPLRGDYGLIVPGKTYEIKDATAAELLKRGLVSVPQPESEPEAKPKLKVKK